MMRAKMQVQSVKKFTHGEELHLKPVVGQAPFGAEGQSEDNTYSRYTPSGELTLLVTNPDLYGKIVPGQKFYVDFTEASE